MPNWVTVAPVKRSMRMRMSRGAGKKNKADDGPLKGLHSGGVGFDSSTGADQSNSAMMTMARAARAIIAVKQELVNSC